MDADQRFSLNVIIIGAMIIVVTVIAIDVFGVRV
jgi:hypothetical protein